MAVILLRKGCVSEVSYLMQGVNPCRQHRAQKLKKGREPKTASHSDLARDEKSMDEQETQIPEEETPEETPAEETPAEQEGGA